jgi:hypothetical protein
VKTIFGERHIFGSLRVFWLVSVKKERATAKLPISIKITIRQVRYIASVTIPSHPSPNHSGEQMQDGSACETQELDEPQPVPDGLQERDARLERVALQAHSEQPERGVPLVRA